MRTSVGGYARYQNDYYQQVSQDITNVPGNPWFICTLWMAEYAILAAKTRDDLKRAADLITWVVEHALPSGVLAEQVHPYSGAPLSVSPLTWSHAALVVAVQAYVAKWHLIETQENAPPRAQWCNLIPASRRSLRRWGCQPRHLPPGEPADRRFPLRQETRTR